MSDILKACDIWSGKYMERIRSGSAPMKGKDLVIRLSSANVIRTKALSTLFVIVDGATTTTR